MSEDAGEALPPYVLDVSVLAEVARFDLGTITALQSLDAQGRRLVLPVLALTGASLDMRGEEAEELLEGTGRLRNAETAPVADRTEALALAEVISRRDLDPYDAHTAAVADASGYDILTVNGAKWRQHSHDLDRPLGYVEIAEPDEG